MLDKRHKEKMKRNMQIFEELGLMNTHKCLYLLTTSQENILRNQTNNLRKRPDSVPVAPMRRSPSLMEQQIDALEMQSQTCCSTTSSRTQSRRGDAIANF